MIVDTSVLVGILLHEAEAAQFVSALATADILRISAGNWVEAGAVTSDAHRTIRDELGNLLATYGVLIEPVTVEQARVGHDAYRIFGKRHHRAHLNLGDCFAYALARQRGQRLTSV